MESHRRMYIGTGLASLAALLYLSTQTPSDTRVHAEEVVDAGSSLNPVVDEIPDVAGFVLPMSDVPRLAVLGNDYAASPVVILCKDDEGKPRSPDDWDVARVVIFQRNGQTAHMVNRDTGTVDKIGLDGTLAAAITCAPQPAIVSRE